MHFDCFSVNMGTRAKPMLQLVLDTIDFPKGLENSSNKPANSGKCCRY